MRKDISRIIIFIFFIIVVVALVTAFFLFQNKKSYRTAENTKQQPSVANVKNNRYVDYSPAAFEQAANKKRVYYFHANWCPICKVANEAFLKNPDAIAEDIIVFKTDYDTETELKKRYNITYQHTYVQVDGQGNEISKWNGGDIELLSQNIK